MHTKSRRNTFFFYKRVVTFTIWNSHLPSFSKSNLLVMPDSKQVHLISPPKPPDINTNQISNEATLSILSFKEKLVEGDQDVSINMIIDTSLQYSTELQDIGQEDKFIHSTNDRQVKLSQEDFQRIFQPWKYSTIVKLQGRRIQHHLLKRKLHYGKLKRTFH